MSEVEAPVIVVTTHGGLVFTGVHWSPVVHILTMADGSWHGFAKDVLASVVVRRQ